MLKELNDSYFSQHPVKEISVARLEYSFYLMPDINQMAEEFLKDKIVPTEEELEHRAIVDAADKPEDLLQCMRKNLPLDTRKTLRSKMIERQDELKPLVQNKAITALRDVFIENTLYFFLHERENDCNWILQNYESLHSEYLRSLLCLVLGIRGELSMIPFLKQKVARFERYFPDESYDQGPLLALHELKARFDGKNTRDDIAMFKDYR